MQFSKKWLNEFVDKDLNEIKLRGSELNNKLRLKNDNIKKENKPIQIKIEDNFFLLTIKKLFLQVQIYFS